MADYTYDYSWGSGPSQLPGPNVPWVLGAPGFSTGSVTFGGGQSSNVCTATTGNPVLYARSPGAPAFGPNSVVLGVALVFIMSDTQAGDTISSAFLLHNGDPLVDLGVGLSVPVGQNVEVVVGGPRELWGRSWTYADHERTNYQLRLQSGPGAIPASGENTDHDDENPGTGPGGGSGGGSGGLHTVGVNGALTRYYVQGPGGSPAPFRGAFARLPADTVTVL